MAYRFERVDETSHKFFACCLACEKTIYGPKWADLNGKPFAAYYCEPCKQAKEKEHEIVSSL